MLQYSNCMVFHMLELLKRKKLWGWCITLRKVRVLLCWRVKCFSRTKNINGIKDFQFAWLLSLLACLTACPLLNFESSSSRRRSGGISQAVSVWQHINSLTSCSFRFTHSSGWWSRALGWLFLWSERMFVSYETKRIWDVKKWTTWHLQLLSSFHVPNRTSGRWRKTQRSRVETWMSCRTLTG